MSKEIWESHYPPLLFICCDLRSEDRSMSVHNEQRNTQFARGRSILFSGPLGPCPRIGRKPRLHRALEAVGAPGSDQLWREQG